MAREALLKLCFPIIALLMVLIGGLLTLLSILWAIVTHPFTVFKKVNRNGKELLLKTYYDPFLNQRLSNKIRCG